MTVRVLGRSPSYARPERLGTTNDDAAYDLLTSAVWYIDAATPGTQGVTVPNLGTGGSALDAQYGSTSGADTNDPLLLAHTDTNYVYLPGAASNYLQVPSSTALNVSGDIDIRVKVALDSWVSSSHLLTKSGAAGNAGYAFTVSSVGGVLRFTHSPDGTTVINDDSTVAPTVSDGDTLWVRVTCDVDNGAGGYDTKFWTSSDGTAWTQLGATVTGGSTTSNYASTAALRVGHAGSGTAYSAAGKFYRAIVKDGIDGTTVLNVDTSVITSGAQTTFTEQSANAATVTIGRSTSGRKAVAVVAPVWLLGTDDYLQVADNDLLDFGASDSFTVLAVVRQWATQGTGAIIDKGMALDTTAAGYGMFTATSTANGFAVADGTTRTVDYEDNALGTIEVLTGVRDVGTDNITLFRGTTGTGTTDATTGNPTGSTALYVGRRSGTAGYYVAAEVFAAAVFRRALTAGEVAVLSTYFAGRCR